MKKAIPTRILEEEEELLKIKMKDVNPHITCSLCAGYFIDATTITECLHTYCKSCIVKYIKATKKCPQCRLKVHESQPVFFLRPDRTLQDIVYKLVPHLLENEEKKRAEYNKITSVNQNGQGQVNLAPRLSSIINNPQGHLYKFDEQICLCIEKYSYQKIQHNGKWIHLQPLDKKFVRCSIRVLVSHIKSMLYKKLPLSENIQLEVLCEDEEMQDEMSLKQIYLMYWYTKETPMILFYRFKEACVESGLDFT